MFLITYVYVSYKSSLNSIPPFSKTHIENSIHSINTNPIQWIEISPMDSSWLRWLELLHAIKNRFFTQYPELWDDTCNNISKYGRASFVRFRDPLQTYIEWVTSK